ncbi:proline racemase family protein, partial [Pseudomonas sp. MH10out]|uniref:proline racemase family protein n=1 Tax=Pseudomonas sp. MH10out TaxID=3048628 RepID=UPI002B2364AE
MKPISVIDSHTGGEPTRMVIDGFPELGRGSLAQRRTIQAEQFDDWRASTMLEPR